jgi:3-hydroxyacyl-CoA dehydrogenase/enoyl-CoA hydratase/3-hydroxybutyryl-CoA epimerase
MKNFTLDIDTDSIALLTWNMPDKSMNVWDQSSLSEFEVFIERFVTDAAIKGLVITSGKETFCGGADISMLAAMRKEAEAIKDKQGELAAKQFLFDQSSRLSKVFRKMETAKKPVAVALTGTAMGGGWEVSLAAHARFAAENSSAKVGLPEVKIGLLPGAGGTTRMMRLLPTQDALQALLQGKELRLDKALSMKLLNAIVPKEKLIETAKAWVKTNPNARAPWDEEKFKSPGGAVYSAAGMQVWPPASALLRKETYDNYPAARMLLRAAYEGLLLPFDTALKVELRYFVYLLQTKEAAAMIRTFFLSLQDINKGARRPKAVQKAQLKKIGILGAGFMGAGIAYVTAKAGIDVTLIDRDQASADKGKAYCEKLISDLVIKGRAKPTEKDELLARIFPSADYNALKDVDLVIEAVFEDRKVKAEAFAKTAAVIGHDVVFGSNTSTLPITSLAEMFARPKDFIGVHFFSPVEKMQLVEIIMGKETGDKALATALDYVKAIKKTPIVVNDTRGFYANRCVGNYLREGNLMLNEGVPPALIENLARQAGMPVGPLALYDEVGIDLIWKIIQATKLESGNIFADPVQEQQVRLLVEDKKRLGRKSGAGFYDYPKNDKKRLWPELSSLFPSQEAENFNYQELQQRFLVTQALEAARCIEENVVTDMREADIGAIFGFGFAPFTGGPISYIDGMGVRNFVDLAEKLKAKYGERFQPSSLLFDLAKKNESFYTRFAPPSVKAA